MQILVIAHENKADVYVKEGENVILKTKGNIGKCGIGKEREGDNKTPIGTYKLGKIFGIKENPGTKLPYIKVNQNMYWIDDCNSKYYNELVEVIDSKKNNNTKTQYIQIQKEDIDWKTAEHLYDYKVQYSYAIEIKYNKEKIKEKGSAIFLHVENCKPTSGCISIPEKDIIEIIKKIEENSEIHIS